MLRWETLPSLGQGHEVSYLPGERLVLCCLLPGASTRDPVLTPASQNGVSQGCGKECPPLPPDSVPQPNCASFYYSKYGGRSRGQGVLTAKEEEMYVRKMALCQPHIRVRDLRCEMALWKNLGALGSGVEGRGQWAGGRGQVAGWFL